MATLERTSLNDLRRWSDFRAVNGAGAALDVLGDIARQRSAARFWKEWELAEGLIERFPNLNKWTLSSAGALVVGTASGNPNLGNAVFGTAGPTFRNGVRGFSIPAGGYARVMARINVVNAQVTSATSIGIGITNRTITQLTASDFSNSVTVSFDSSVASGTAKPVSIFNGTTDVETGTIPAVSDIYLFGIIVDPNNVTAFIRSDDGSVELKRRIARAGLSYDKIFISNNDSRGTSGHGIGPIGAIRHLGPTPAASFADSVSDQIHLSTTVTTSDPFRVTLPKTYDARTPPPVWLYCHGADGDENEVFTHTGVRPLTQAFLDAGFIVASASFGGNLFNNDVALGKVAELYQYLRDNYALGPIIIAGNSMGGPLAMTLITRKTVPAISGLMVFQSAITHLDEAAATNAALVPYFVGATGSVAAAFGYTPISNDAAGAQAMVRDPAFRLLIKDADPYEISLRSPQLFRGLPMRLYASPDDTYIAKANHADKLAASLKRYQAEINVVTTSGDHNTVTQFPTADPVNWAKGLIGAL